MINKDESFERIATDVFLWVYSSKTGQVKKYENVDIYQRKSPFSNANIQQYYATSDVGLERLVSGIEDGVWYYPRYREYLIWSRSNNDSRIKQIFMKTLKQKAKENIKEALTMIRQEHDILDTAASNLLTNCIITTVSYDDVKQVVDQYFLNF